MTINLKPSKVTMILIAGAGWETIVKGSLKIDTLELQPPSPTSEAEDYGFEATHDSGDEITGRLSALLATREAA